MLCRSCAGCSGLQNGAGFMKSFITPASVTRRDFLSATSSLATAALAGASPGKALAAQSSSAPPRAGFSRHPLLTPADKFRDVSRGNPKPHTLRGEALVQARLTPETWRLEIISDETPHPDIQERASIGKPLRLENGTALDLDGLLRLGQKHGVKLLKAMQCLNIPNPLGQGLWEGAPLRDVLRLCGTMRNVRRIYY